MYGEYVILVPSGHRLTCIDQNVACDVLYPKVAETPGSEILEVLPWCFGSIDKYEGPQGNFFALWNLHP